METSMVGTFPQRLSMSESKTSGSICMPFEHDNVAFWNFFTATFAQLLGFHIEQKTKHFLRKKGVDGKDEGEWRSVLNKTRKNFRNNPNVEIFKMRTLLLNSFSPLMRHFCENVANAPALDDVYNALGSFVWNGHQIWPMSAMPDILSRFHLACPLGQGVRNRYKIVMDSYIKSGGGDTLSIACGSAQPLIHAARKLQEMGRGCFVKLTLSDMEPSSLELAHRRAQQAGVDHRIMETVVAPLHELPIKLTQKFDIIEACGICDYFTDAVVRKRILKSISSMLRDGGKLIVSGMAETPAAELLRKVYNWDIVYRDAEVFADLVNQAGFSGVSLHEEPWGIYYVVTATK